MVSEYLEFIQIPNEGFKTKKFQIVSRKYGFPLGEVKFYNKWRTYCFFPFPETFFNRTCLGEIEDFILDVKRGTEMPWCYNEGDKG